MRFENLAACSTRMLRGALLWMRKRWAEWLTCIITASLIPLEVWEFAYRPNLGKAAVVIGNAAIVAYLVWHVRGKGRSAPGAGAVAPVTAASGTADPKAPAERGRRGSGL